MTGSKVTATLLHECFLLFLELRQDESAPAAGAIGLFTLYLDKTFCLVFNFSGKGLNLKIYDGNLRS